LRRRQATACSTSAAGPAGWFTRRADADELVATGLDSSAAALAYARAQSGPTLNWAAGDARDLPFVDAGFDHVLSIAALCFVADERQAVTEIVRVARRRFAIGWLNRHSMLYREKGRDGGRGAYRGAHWHTAEEVRALFTGLPVARLALRSAIFLPSATRWARRLERVMPAALPWGGMLFVTGGKT